MPFASSILPFHLRLIVPAEQERPIDLFRKQEQGRDGTAFSSPMLDGTICATHLLRDVSPKTVRSRYPHSSSLVRERTNAARLNGGTTRHNAHHSVGLAPVWDYPLGSFQVYIRPLCRPAAPSMGAICLRCL